MPLPIFQVDAFASAPFSGNPAAVVPLPHWLAAETLQSIAEENNLAETAFFVPLPPGEEAHFHLRWFTPVAEVDLCGHATLASAAVLFRELGFAEQEVRFQTRSGVLRVSRATGGFRMLLPATTPVPIEAPATLSAALGGVALEQTLAGYDLLAVLGSESAVSALRPDLALLAELPFRAVVVTAQGTEADFVSRCFGPRIGIPEDPVTGSAHCQLLPFWSARLGRTTLVARQLSRRGGTLVCELLGDHVALTGEAALYLKGEIALSVEASGS
jgi:PhzF family phenazine biosynthesis protein